MYVDYVEVDGVHQWVTPSRSRATVPTNPRRSLGLVANLYVAGAATPDGVRLINQVWRDHEALWAPRTPTRHPDRFGDEGQDIDATIASLNCATLDGLERAGFTHNSYSPVVRAAIISYWSLPLSHVDTALLKVTDEGIAAQRARWVADQAGDY